MQTLWISETDRNDLRWRPPRKRHRNRYRQFDVEWVECVEDFAGNSGQAGFWADMWVDGAGINYLSVGGLWEAHLQPKRHHVRRLHRYRYIRRVDGPVTSGKISDILKREWGPANVELPKADILFKPCFLHGHRSINEAWQGRKRQEGVLIHSEALIRPVTRAELELLRSRCEQRKETGGIALGSLELREIRVHYRFRPTVYEMSENGRVKFVTACVHVCHRLMLNRIMKEKPAKKSKKAKK
jgi:hypothetical protein